MLRAGGSGVRNPVGVRELPLLQDVQTDSGVHPTSYRVFFMRVKRNGREANHTPQSCAEVKYEWSLTSTPSICLHSVDRKNLPLFLPLLRRSMVQTAHSCTNYAPLYKLRIIVQTCAQLYKLRTVVQTSHHCTNFAPLYKFRTIVQTSKTNAYS